MSVISTNVALRAARPTDVFSDEFHLSCDAAYRLLRGAGVPVYRIDVAHGPQFFGLNFSPDPVCSLEDLLSWAAEEYGVALAAEIQLRVVA